MADGHAEETEEEIWVKRRPYGPSDDDGGGAIWTIWIPEARKSKWWVFSRQIENLIFGTERPHDPGFFLSMLNHHPPVVPDTFRNGGLAATCFTMWKPWAWRYVPQRCVSKSIPPASMGPSLCQGSTRLYRSAGDHGCSKQQLRGLICEYNTMKRCTFDPMGGPAKQCSLLPISVVPQPPLLSSSPPLHSLPLPTRLAF